jgi:hypothetical protein
MGKLKDIWHKWKMVFAYSMAAGVTRGPAALKDLKNIAESFKGYKEPPKEIPKEPTPKETTPIETKIETPK